MDPYILLFITHLLLGICIKLDSGISGAKNPLSISARFIMDEIIIGDGLSSLMVSIVEEESWLVGEGF